MDLLAQLGAAQLDARAQPRLDLAEVARRERVHGPARNPPLLERLARALFQETSVARPRPPGKRVITTESGTPPVIPGTAPDFESVRERIRRHGTAPLRSE